MGPVTRFLTVDEVLDTLEAAGTLGSLLALPEAGKVWPQERQLWPETRRTV
jgi:hypothetical protein